MERQNNFPKPDRFPKPGRNDVWTYLSEKLLILPFSVDSVRYGFWHPINADEGCLKSNGSLDGLPLAYSAWCVNVASCIYYQQNPLESDLIKVIRVTDVTLPENFLIKPKMLESMLKYLSVPDW